MEGKHKVILTKDLVHKISGDLGMLRCYMQNVTPDVNGPWVPSEVVVLLEDTRDAKTIPLRNLHTLCEKMINEWGGEVDDYVFMAMSGDTEYINNLGGY